MSRGPPVGAEVVYGLVNPLLGFVLDLVSLAPGHLLFGGADETGEAARELPEDTVAAHVILRRNPKNTLQRW